MMKKSNLIVLAVVLVVLLGISLLQRSSHRRATSRSDTHPVLAESFDAEQLQRLEIGYGTTPDALVLENLPDGWAVRTAYGHPANPTRVQTLLDHLGDLGGEFRSDAAAVLADYGFTDSTSVTIAAYGPDGDEPVFALEIGKKPQRATGNFVRLPSSSAVYLTRQGLLGDLGLYGGPGLPAAKHFLELQAHKIERDEVDAITLHDGGAVVALVKEFAEPEPDPADTTGVAPQPDRKVYEWRLTRPHDRAALKTKADAVLGALSGIRAVDVADPDGDPAAYGLADPQRRAEIRLQDGTTITLDFGTEREAEGDNPAGLYFRVAGERTVWVIGTYIPNNIFKTEEELLPSEE